MSSVWLVSVKSRKYGWKRTCFWYPTKAAADCCVEGYVDIGVPLENLRKEEFYSARAEQGDSAC